MTVRTDGRTRDFFWPAGYVCFYCWRHHPLPGLTTINHIANHPYLPLPTYTYICICALYTYYILYTHTRARRVVLLKSFFL